MNKIVRFFHPFSRKVVARVLCAYHDVQARAFFDDATGVDGTFQPCDWCEATSHRGGERLRGIVGRETGSLLQVVSA